MVERPEDPVRWDKIARIKQEIAAGTYETADKLEAALEAFLERQVLAVDSGDADSCD